MKYLNLLLAISLSLTLSACASKTPMKTPLKSYNAQETAILKTPDSKNLAAQWWLPSGEPKGALLVIHGTAMNAGFYELWAKHANTHGYAVLGVDMRGWGQSDGDGKRGYVKDFNEYLIDVETAAAHIKARYPDKPFFIQGESLGGGIALMAAISGKVPSDGVILNAPATIGNPGFGKLRAPQFLVNLGLDVVGFSARVAPSFPFLPTYRIGISTVFMDDEATSRFMSDPYNTKTWIPAYYITQTNALMKYVQDYAMLMRAPFLIQHGTKDRLVPLSSSQWFYEKAQSKDKTLKVYEGLSHGALHVKGNEQLWADAIAWLDERSKVAEPEPYYSKY